MLPLVPFTQLSSVCLTTTVAIIRRAFGYILFLHFHSFKLLDAQQWYVKGTCLIFIHVLSDL